MPYQWTRTSDYSCLEAWPYRSLPKKGFVIVIGLAYGLTLLPLLAVLGTVVLWGLLPFALGAVAALWWGLRRSYRDGELLEELTISPTKMTLVRSQPKKPVLRFSCNPYWAKVQLHPSAGPVPHYLTIKGDGREVEVGAFLSEDERRDLYNEIWAEIARFKTAR